MIPRFAVFEQVFWKGLFPGGAMLCERGQHLPRDASGPGAGAKAVEHCHEEARRRLERRAWLRAGASENNGCQHTVHVAASR